MNEPSPIRGRWTLRGWLSNDREPQPIIDVIAGPPIAPDTEVEVVSVPDEQAIERAAKEIAMTRFKVGLNWDEMDECGKQRWIDEARAVVAALEQPDAGP